jgi:hypothetical protein
MKPRATIPAEAHKSRPARQSRRCIGHTPAVGGLVLTSSDINIGSPTAGDCEIRTLRVLLNKMPRHPAAPATMSFRRLSPQPSPATPWPCVSPRRHQRQRDAPNRTIEGRRPSYGRGPRRISCDQALQSMLYSAANSFRICAPDFQMDQRHALSVAIYVGFKRIGKSRGGVRGRARVQVDSLPEQLGSLVKTDHIGGFFQLLKFERIDSLGSFIQIYGAVFGGRPLRAKTTPWRSAIKRRRPASLSARVLSEPRGISRAVSSASSALAMALRPSGESRASSVIANALNWAA